MSLKVRNLLGATIVGASFFCNAPAMARPAPTTCSNISGNGVTVTECSNGYSGSYSLLNESTEDIFAFYVSTQAPQFYQYAWSNRTNWVGSYYSESDWDSDKVSSSYGSFQSLFGSADTGVFGYRYHQNGEEPTGVILTGVDTGHQFFFNAEPSSEFIAIGTQGMIARSYNPTTSDVPEPGSLALLGLGIAGLGLVRRKRQTK